MSRKLYATWDEALNSPEAQKIMNTKSPQYPNGRHVAIESIFIGDRSDYRTKYHIAGTVEDVGPSGFATVYSSEENAIAGKGSMYSDVRLAPDDTDDDGISIRDFIQAMYKRQA